MSLGHSLLSRRHYMMLGSVPCTCDRASPTLISPLGSKAGVQLAVLQLVGMWVHCIPFYCFRGYGFKVRVRFAL